MLIDMSLAMKLARSKDALQSHPGLTVTLTLVACEMSLILIQGTRIFVAIRVLQNVAAKSSAIFDMESVLWTLIFVPLYQNRKRLGDWDTVRYRQLVPENRTYQTDSFVKAALLQGLTLKGSIAEDSVLLPYEDLLVNMATLAQRYYHKTQLRAFEGYDLAEEADALEKNILIVEAFLDTHRSALA